MAGPSCDTQVVLFSMVGKPLMTGRALTTELVFYVLSIGGQVIEC
jgi:hypothetical protein